MEEKEEVEHEKGDNKVEKCTSRAPLERRKYYFMIVEIPIPYIQPYLFFFLELFPNVWNRIQFGQQFIEACMIYRNGTVNFYMKY
jgi:hypothetical protein